MTRLTFIARTAGFCGIVAIIIPSLVPGYERPHTGLSGHIEHFIAYGLTASALALGFRSLSFRFEMAGGLALLAGLMEVLQKFVPGRHSALSDAIASSFGGLAGLALGGILYELLILIDQRRQALKQPLRFETRDKQMS